MTSRIKTMKNIVMVRIDDKMLNDIKKLAKALQLTSVSGTVRFLINQKLRERAEKDPNNANALAELYE